MNIFFNDDIYKEPVQELVDKLDSTSNQLDINLWFQTNGGETEVMDFLISVLNSISERVTVTLTGALISAGTKLLTDFKGKIVISEGFDFALFHKWDRELYTLRKGVVSAKKLIKTTEEENKNFAKKLKEKKLLTDKQIKSFLKGEDVVVYREQIKKWKL